MKVIVTGADGFVGSYLIPRLIAAGHEITACISDPARAEDLRRQGCQAVNSLELRDPESVAAAFREPADWVVHLAAVASGGDSAKDPGRAWEVNAAGTARIADLLARQHSRGIADPFLLLASTGEVYGRGQETPRVETDPLEPCSPYAASKLGAEVAVLESGRCTGLRVCVARSFPHTGPGQDGRFVIPAFAKRILMAKQRGAPAVNVGNLTPVREFMHVSDVVDAYVSLLEDAPDGEVFNVASGVAVSVEDVFAMLCDIAGHRVIPEPDASLVRPSDIPYLVGDAAKLKAATGWEPKISLEETLTEVVDAQTD